MLKFSIGGLIMAAIHIAIVAYTLAQIIAAGAVDWTVYWRIFLALDFPVSLTVVPLTWIFPAVAHRAFLRLRKLLVAADRARPPRNPVVVYRRNVDRRKASTPAYARVESAVVRRNSYMPQRSAGVCTGASHNRFSSSVSMQSVIEQPAMSSEVT